jgi:hypothetical protein
MATSLKSDDVEKGSIIEASWDKAEQDLLERRRLEERDAQIREEEHPTRRPMHRCVILISLLTCAAATLMSVGQIMGLFIFRSFGPIQYVLHFYVLLLCIIVVLVECEWTPVGRDSFIFSYWITRGMSYAFIGVLGLEENASSNWKNPTDLIQNFVKVVAWLMIGSGAIYFLMGLVCLQIYYNRLRKDYEERMLRAQHFRRGQLPSSQRNISPTSVNDAP